MAHFRNRIASWYDRLAESNVDGQHFFERSDFLNFGYWLKNTPSQQAACETLLEKLLHYIPQKRGTILDVACGKGATTRHLLRYYPPQNVTGINISEKQLEICREVAPGVTFLLMDATSLEFPDESFDNIICVEAACHFDTRDDFLREAHRVLKPGGRLVMSDLRLAHWSPVQPKANYTHSPDQYRRTFLRAGFEDVDLVDATQACWEGYARHLYRDALGQRLREEITDEQFAGIMAYLRSTAARVQNYFLVACTRGAAAPRTERKAARKTDRKPRRAYASLA